MLGRKPLKKCHQGAKGKGAAAAKQLGLFVDFNTEEMMQGMDDNDVDDADLEEELAALTGKKAPAANPKPKGKAPLPMEHIEKMAEDCMRDFEDEDDDDEDMEEDEDLLAELQEVVGEDEESEETLREDESLSEAYNDTATTEKPVAVEHNLTSPVASQEPSAQGKMSTADSELQQSIQSRIENYKTAIVNAKEAGDTSRVRRYERGLKTLETMLSGVRKGKKIIEEEIPPPVASGKSAPRVPLEHILAESASEDITTESIRPPKDDSNSSSDREIPLPLTHRQSTDQALLFADIDDKSTHLRALLVARQKEYKLAALKAKQQGNIEKAKQYMKTGKKFDLAIEGLDNDQPLDLSNLPSSPESPVTFVNTQIPYPETSSEHSQPSATNSSPGPETSGVPQQPGTVLEALQQRMEKYKSAAEQAKASGDERKARMHERIAKQYQDAIRAQKAGRKVNFEELPIPPGFPPIPGMETTGGDTTVAGVLEAASKLATAEVKENDDDDEDDDGDETGTAVLPPVAKKPAKLPERPIQIVKPLIVPPAMEVGKLTPEQTKKAIPSASPRKSSSADQLSPAAREQLEFLENRKKQYLKAALQAKQKNDLEQAKVYLKTAKSFDPNIELAKIGKSVDISKLPSPPTDDESEFIFVHHNDVKISQKSEEVYTQLLKLLKEQYEKCMQYARQFTHMGNVTETTRFEKLAQNCKKNVDILQLAQAQGLDPPPHHFEEKTFKIVRIFAELSSTEMLLIIVKGINLPSPSGVATNDLDAFVKFEFHYPSAEQAQKNKTTVIKNTNSPDYDQHFKLNINRNHRGFKRVIQAKGIKFEIYHKGSFFFRSDKLVGTAQLKLDRLESECEIREIIEIFDGRKPTGGKLEVKARLREPLSGQDLQTITESWLVLEQSVGMVGKS
ncbi:coiled-coil and C2 domain-containing protein 1B [Ambystoma mexicanum]|uniref:coiled-coil and C2 domain-containing protein 1B n=1 Tax=Ambystoma mexicanum TaxID=8296 RepID=UPI0037E7EF40